MAKAPTKKMPPWLIKAKKGDEGEDKKAKAKPKAKAKKKK